MQKFKINKEYDAICESKNTRNGFKHIATLLHNGNEVESVKICYLNRTWERYQFESVLQKLLEKTDVLGSARKVKNFLDKNSSY